MTQMTTLYEGTNRSAVEEEPLLVALDDATDRSRIGAKAMSLAEMRRAGRRVPDGFVVPTEVCATLVEGASPALREAVAQGLKRLGDDPVAVRSSAVAEDGVAASFAGQFLTVLNLRGVDAVCEAIVDCVRSAREGRVEAYRRELASDGSDAIAVLVQRMVAAEASGVAFSVNPTTGDDEVVIGAVRGLGDALVGGEVASEDWVVGEGVTAPASAEVLDEETARRLAEMVRDLAREAGAPRDVEWALRDGEIHLLQSRPVTAVPIRPSFDDDPTEGIWTRDRVHYPAPMTAFGGSTYLPCLERIFGEWIEEHGLLADGFEQHWRSGDVYGRVVPPGGKDGPPPPWWVLAVASRVVPMFRKKMKAAARIIESGALEDRVRVWRQGQREDLDREIRELAARDLGALSAEERLEHLDEILALAERSGLLHMRLFIPWLVEVRHAVVLCEERLGWPSERALGLLAGHSQTSSAPGRELAELAAGMKEVAGARQALDADDPLEALRAVDERLAEGVATWIERWGLRSTGYDPGSLTLAEQPGLLWNLVRDGVDGALRDKGDDALERELAEALESLPADERRELEDALAEARDIFGLREDNVLYTDNLVLGLARRAVLAVGEALVSAGHLRHADEVVDLTIDEIRAAVRGELEDAEGLARRRRAERAWVAAHPGPAVLCGEPAPPPTIRGLPEAGQRLNEAFIWAVGMEFPEMSRGSSRSDDEGDLQGIGAWPGTYEGTVRIVRGHDDLDRVRPGDVLVAPITTPSWSVVFPRIGALVTDCGGALSHAAIVAREHGVPTVLNTEVATSRLRDGQRVLVDGARGRVRCLSGRGGEEA
jgi:pyruvate,water dikinase